MNDNICEGIIVESCNGREFFGAKTVVDATGDATVMHRASVPTVIEKNYMTYVSHYCDIEAAEKLCNDGDFSSFRKWIKTGSDMFGNGHPQGLDLLTGETAEEITSYIISGKKSLLKKNRTS